MSSLRFTVMTNFVPSATFPGGCAGCSADFNSNVPASLFRESLSLLPFASPTHAAANEARTTMVRPRMADRSLVLVIGTPQTYALSCPHRRTSCGGGLRFEVAA
jgi:hypothetical protein